MKLIHRLVLPLIRREVPGWGRLYNRFVGGYRQDAEWAGEPIQVIRGKLHGYEMDLDLSWWGDRITFFLGRHYDLGTQLLISGLLRPGDRFVDIGANVGMMTLLGAGRVGAEGRVDSFEPNPACAEHIRSLIARNQISHIHVHEAAAGDVDSELTLVIPRYNSEEASFTRFGSAEADDRFDHKRVPVRRADAILSEDPRPPILIKSDAEGYECFVLRGLIETIRGAKPIVTTEVVAVSLKQAGNTPGDITAFFEELGYQGWTMGLRKAGARHVFDLTPIDHACASYDAIWIPNEGPALQRFVESYPALAARLELATAAGVIP